MLYFYSNFTGICSHGSINNNPALVQITDAYMRHSASMSELSHNQLVINFSLIVSSFTTIDMESLSWLQTYKGLLEATQMTGTHFIWYTVIIYMHYNGFIAVIVEIYDSGSEMLQAIHW